MKNLSFNQTFRYNSLTISDDFFILFPIKVYKLTWSSKDINTLKNIFKIKLKSIFYVLII
jgi:hypothetical protein